MKKIKKFSPNAFKLWKHDGKKWYTYNAVFDSGEKDSLQYLRACRMVDKGWIPFAIAAKPDRHQPLELEMVDTGKLDSILTELDPLGKQAGEAIKEFMNSPRKHVEPPESLNPIVEKKVYDLALEKAIQAYKNGSWVSPHLLPKVINHVYGNK